MMTDGVTAQEVNAVPEPEAPLLTGACAGFVVRCRASPAMALIVDFDVVSH